MQFPPEHDRRYDEYEPHKYACISVDDRYLEDILHRFDGIDCFWHTTSVKGKGLTYCGVTLIPPCSLEAFADAVADVYGLQELEELSAKAYRENKWMIHFGL